MGYFDDLYGSAAPSGFTGIGTPAPTQQPFNNDYHDSPLYYEDEQEGFFDLLGASTVESVAGPFVGLAEWIHAVPAGTRESMRTQYEETKASFYGDDPSFGKKAVAAASYWGPMIAASAMIPAASGAALGARLGVSRIVASGIIGAGEGAIVGFGDSAGRDFSDALTMGAFGGAVGGVAGYGAGRFAARSARKAIGDTGAELLSGGRIVGGDALEILDVGRKLTGKTSSLMDSKISAKAYAEQLNKMAKGGDAEIEEAVDQLKFALNEQEGFNISLKNLDENIGWAERVLKDRRDNNGQRVYDDFYTWREVKGKAGKVKDFTLAENAFDRAEKIIRKAVGSELKPVLGGQPNVGRGVQAFRESADKQQGGKVRRVFNYFTDSTRGVGEKAMRVFEGGDGAIAKTEREADTMFRRVMNGRKDWVKSGEFQKSEGYRLAKSRQPDRSDMHLASDAIDNVLESGISNQAKTTSTRRHLIDRYNLPEDLVENVVYFRDKTDELTTRLQREIIRPDIDESVRRTARRMIRNNSTIHDVVRGQDEKTIYRILNEVAERAGKDSEKNLEETLGDVIETLLETGDEYTVPPEMLKDGFLTAIKLKSLDNVLEFNKGKYLGRDYGAFDGADIVSRLQDPGGSFIERMMQTKPGRVAWNKAFDSARAANPGASDKKVVEILTNQLLMKDDPLKNMSAGLFATGANFGSLRPTKSHPRYIRELLQERSSGMDRARFTLAHLSSDLGHVQTLRKMYPEMIENGTLQKSGTATISHPVRITGASSTSPISDLPWIRDSQGAPMTLYATRDIGNLLNASKDRAGNAVFLAINGMVHLSKTALSPGTHVRNFISAFGQTAAQGHLVNPKTLWEATTLAAAGVNGRLPVEVANESIRAATARGFSQTKQEVYEMVLEIESRGVLGKGVRSGEIELFLEGTDEALGRRLGPKVGKAVGKTKEFATRSYILEDNAHKISLGIAEKRRFKKHLLAAGVDDATAETVSRSMGADVTADSMMNYNRLPKAVQWARSQAVIGPFVSFPSEIIRNTANTGKRILREIRGQIDPFQADLLKKHLTKPQLDAFLKSSRSIGMQRAAGLIGVSVGLTTAYEGMTSILTDDQANPSALRELLPYWSENSSVHTMEFAPGERVKYLDSSYLNPYATIIKPITALLHAIEDPYDEGREKLMMRAFAEAGEPFLGPELILTEALSAVENMNRISEMNPEKKAQEVLYRFYRAFAPGLITSAERIGRAAGGNDYTSWAMPNWLKEELPSETFYGTKYELGPEIKSVFMGARMNTMDIPKATLWRARDFKRAYNQSLSMISKVKNSTPAKRHRALIEANVGLHKNAEIIIRKIRAARDLGVSLRKIKQILNESGVPKKFHRYIMNGDISRIKIYETRRKRH